MVKELDRTLAPASGPLRNIPLPAYQEEQLDNGMPVYLLPYGMVDVAGIMVVFKAGDAFEDRPGIAQYTAANLSEGTANFTSLGLAQELDSFGAWIDAETGHEFVSVNLTSLSRHLSATVPLLKEVAFSPVFPEEEFAKMKERNLQKMAVQEKKTAYHARRAFGHMLFGKDHPYGVHIGREELEAIKLEDLTAYHVERLQAGNCFLAVVGKFDRSETMALLNSIFGSLPIEMAPSGSSNAGAQSIQTKLGYKHIPVEGMQSTLRMGHLGFSRAHPDYYGMQVVNTILGGYFGSRLMKNIREEKGYTYGIYSAFVSMTHGGYFLVQGDVGNEYVEQTIAEVEKEINKLINEGVGEGELQLVKNYLLGKSIGKRETPFQLGNVLRYSIVNGLSFEEIDRQFDVIRDIQPSKIMELAGKYLDPDNLLTVVSGGSENVSE